MLRKAALLTSLFLLVPAVAQAATLEVGPGKTYATPCQAIAAAQPNDVIEIDAAGTYDGDVCGWTTSGLTIRGVNGRPKIDANGKNAQGKAIWVVSGDDTTIENVELTGCHVPDMNGAGIRQEGKNLTLRRAYIHDNEDGILAGDKAGSTIVIEYSEFDHNGAGDGYSHNMYVNHVDKFVLRYSWSHRAHVGHLVKSRALETDILYDRLTDEDGDASYELDMPNGGKGFVIGNVIEQGAATQNPNIVAFGEEGAMAGSALYLVNDTIVNNRMNGGTFIKVAAGVTSLARNVIFAGPGTPASDASTTLDHVLSMTDPMFVDAAGFDFHLKDGSPAVDAGADPGMAEGQSLAPTNQYVHPADTESRTTVGTIDMGAFELGGGGVAGGSSTGAGGSGSSGAGGASATSGAGGGNGAASGTGGSTASAGGDGTNGGDAADAGDDGGCGCRTAGTGSSGGAPALALVALGAIVALRRRR